MVTAIQFGGKTMPGADSCPAGTVPQSNSTYTGGDKNLVKLQTNNASWASCDRSSLSKQISSESQMGFFLKTVREMNLLSVFLSLKNLKCSKKHPHHNKTAMWIVAQ